MASHHERLGTPDELGMSPVETVAIASESPHTPVITEQVISQSSIMTVLDHVSADHEGAISPAMRERLPRLISHAFNAGALSTYVAANAEKVTQQAESYRFWFGDTQNWAYPSEMLLAGNRDILKGTIEAYGKMLDDALQDGEKNGGILRGNDRLARSLNHHVTKMVVQYKEDAYSLAALLTGEHPRTYASRPKTKDAVTEEKTSPVTETRPTGNAYPYILHEGMSGAPRTFELFSFDETQEGEVQVASSGIASMLRVIDDGTSFGNLKKEAIPVISRALQSGAIAEVERSYPERVARLAKEYTYWLGGKKGKGGVSGAMRVAYAGNREMVGAALITYANQLVRDAEANGGSIDDQTSKEREKALDLSSIIFPRPQEKMTLQQALQEVDGDVVTNVVELSDARFLDHTVFPALAQQDESIDFSTNEGLVKLQQRFQKRREENDSAADLPYEEKQSSHGVLIANADIIRFIHGDTEQAS